MLEEVATEIHWLRSYSGIFRSKESKLQNTNQKKQIHIDRPWNWTFLMSSEKMWLGRRLFPSRLALLLLLFLIGALNFVLWQVVTLLWIEIMLMKEVVFFRSFWCTWCGSCWFAKLETLQLPTPRFNVIMMLFRRKSCWKVRQNLFNRFGLF